MLEAYLRNALGPKSKVYSAGTEPSGVDPQAIRVMAEDRVVIAGHTSDAIEEYSNRQFDLILILDPSTSEAVERICRAKKTQVYEVSEVNGFGGPERMQRVRELRDELKKLALKIAQEIQG